MEENNEKKEQTEVTASGNASDVSKDSNEKKEEAVTEEKENSASVAPESSDRKENTEEKPEEKAEPSDKKESNGETAEKAEERATESTEEKTAEKTADNKAKEEKKTAHRADSSHRIQWKSVFRIVLTIAIVFAAAFGGTVAAVSWLDHRFEKALEETQGQDRNDFPFDYEEIEGNGNGSNSNGGSSAKTNTNSAGLGVYIRSDSEKPEIYSFTDDSLADEAGLEIGDVITSVDGTEVDSYDDVVEQLKDKKPGDKVKIGYERNGEKGEAEVELIDRNSSDSNSDSPFSSSKGQMMQ